MQTLSTAPIWRRLVAFIYDAFILVALSFAYGAVLTVIGANTQNAAAQEYQPMFDSPWVFIGWISVLAAFYAWFWKRGGQTIGMKTWRLQLVGTRETSLAWRQILLRLLTAPPLILFFGIGYWLRWFDPYGDCLHDKISSTHVVVLPKKPKT